MASSVVNKPYSDKTLEMLLKVIEQGNKEYSITIDKMPIVTRTNDPELFYDFMDYLEPTTQFVTVKIYQGTSRHSDATCLIMPQNSLNGTPQKAAEEANEPKLNIAKAKSDWEKDRRIEDLEEEVEYLTKKVKTIKRKAEEKIQEVKDKQNSLSGVLETFAPAAAQILATSKLSQAYPALGMLGSLNQEQPEQETHYNPPPISEVKFSAASEPSLTEKQQKQLQFFKQLEKNFEEVELVTIFDFLKRAAHDKELLENLIPNDNENEF
ncbi:hypothetical protein [Bernardetia sp. MNP-M8]|uniref:hypothetical protein n=1 Tax=Bernardetia sp. MNP-M8 TaxID=3127470 RepID=UPI0030CAB1C3